MSLIYHPKRIRAHELASLSQEATAFSAVRQQLSEGSLGFAKLSMLEELHEKCRNLAQKLEGTFKQVVVFGIGGSDLGARAVYGALSHASRNDVEIIFTGDTTDPEAVLEAFDRFRPEEALLIFISKSGVTLEVTGSFLIFYEALESFHGGNASQRVVAITDPEQGSLRRIASERGWHTLPIPAEIGGRFSVLTPVGLFPLMVMGINTSELLRGAREFLNREQEAQTSQQSISAVFASNMVSHYYEGRSATVYASYVQALSGMTAWFSQLWAESLGKRLRRDGTENPIGPLPIAVTGPTYQHSQLQRYVEGPDDTVFLFLNVKTPVRDVKIPDSLHGERDVEGMVGHSLHQIRSVQLEATADSLEVVGKPSATVMLESVCEYDLGEFFMFHMLATAFAAEILNVNAYDQPGVEHGKVLTKQRLQELRNMRG